MDEVAKSFSKGDQRPLLTFFQDEGVFGRVSNPVRAWAPPRQRPVLPQQRVREYLYVYSAVSPDTGDSFSLILPQANQNMMNLFLDEFAKEYKDYRVIIAMDQAGFHPKEEDQSWENLRFIHQPSRSPEVNPTECFWQYLRENHFHNKEFDTLDDLEKEMMEVLAGMKNLKETVKSMVGFKWSIRT